MTITVANDDMLIKSDKMRNLSDFSVKFLGIPENRSNTMSKLVVSMSRPRFSFNSSDSNQRSFTYKDIGKLSYRSVDLEFRDDENSIASMLIYVQIMKQIHRTKTPVSPVGGGKEGRFDLETSLFNAKGEITETYKLKNCFFTDVSYMDLDYRKSDERSVIRVTVEFDNIAFQVTDQIKQMDSFLDDIDVFDWINL